MKLGLHSALNAFAVVMLLSTSGWTQTKSEIYENARRLYEKRDLPGARREFLRLVTSTLPANHSRYYLGRIALLESKPAEAIRWLEPIAGAEPPVLDAAAQIGKAYFETAQFDKARTFT